MSLVLAIEPDQRQASILKRLVREKVRADLVLVDSRDAAIASITAQIPDVILVTALLSPRDEEELFTHLRALDGAEHVQTHTIPQLASWNGEDEGGGLFGKLRGRKQELVAGCDPALFADEIHTFLEQAKHRKVEAAAVRHHREQYEGPGKADSPLRRHTAQTSEWDTGTAPDGTAAADAAGAQPAQASTWDSPFEWRKSGPPAALSVRNDEARPAAPPSPPPLITNVPLAVLAAEDESRASEEERKRLEAERLRLESEANAERERAAKMAAEAEQQRTEAERLRKEAEATARRAKEEERRRLEAEKAREQERLRVEAEKKAAAERARDEERKRAEAERKRVEAEARAAAERAREEERKRAEAERKRAEAEAKAKAAAERALQEERKRAEEERKRLEAEAKAAAERARQEERKRAEEERKRVEAEVKAAAERARQEERKRAEEERKRAEAEAKAAAERARQEERKRAEEERRRLEEERMRLEEERKRMEAEAAAARKREAERLRREAEAAAARAREEELRRLEAERLRIEAEAAAERERAERRRLEQEHRRAEAERKQREEEAAAERRRREEATLAERRGRDEELDRRRRDEQTERRNREEQAAVSQPRAAAPQPKRGKPKKPVEAVESDAPAGRSLLVPDEFAEFREEYDHVGPGVFRHMPLDGWARTEVAGVRGNGDSPEPQPDDLRELIENLTLPPQVAGVSYARGCRIRRVRVPGTAAGKKAHAGNQPLILSKRVLKDVRSGKDTEETSEA